MSQTIEEMGAALAAIHGPGKVAAVAYGADGAAFFRAPTPSEFDTFAMYADDPDAKRKAFTAYVRGCFAGDLAGRELAEVEALAGPAWLHGPAGAAVNRLAGVKEVRPTVFF